MLQKKCWFACVVLCSLVLTVAGCTKKDVDDAPEGAQKSGNEAAAPGTSAEGLPQGLPDPFEAKTPAAPTEAELNVLGPIREENRELLRFMPDNPSGCVVIHPVRAIQAPYFRNDADIAEMIIAEFCTRFNPYFPVNGQVPFANLKRVTFCTNPVKQKPEVDPLTGQPKPVPPVYYPTSVCVLELNTPVDDLLLLSLFNMDGRIAIESLVPVMVNNRKVYDMIPPTEELPVTARLVIASPTTVVFAEGSVAEVNKVFDNEPAQGAIPSRVLRTDMQNGDLIAMYSTEGVPFGFTDMVSPYMMGRSMFMQMQDQQANPMQEQEGILGFVNAVRNMTIRINLQVPEAGNLVQVDVDWLSPADAARWKTAMETPITDMLNSMSFSVEQSKSAIIPPERMADFETRMKSVSFFISLLEELKVNSSGSKLQVALKKIAGFDQSLAEMLAPGFVQARQEKQANLEREALSMIAYYGIGNYLQTNNSRFPHYAIFGENGAPLLSWRVAILPYIGEVELYSQFHLYEPWDSPHNMALIAQMPKIYADPSGLVPAGKTIFRMFGGEGSVLSQFPGGFTANDLKRPEWTLSVISVAPAQAVEWTRPEFVQFDQQTFGQLTRESFVGMFCTGKVLILSTKDPNLASELPYWIAGSVSPEFAEQLDAMRQWQQIQQQMQMQQNQDAMPMGSPQMQLPPMGQP